MIKGAPSLVEAEVLHKPDFRNSLLVVHVAMVGSDIKARALIDSGATHNFVSELWIERYASNGTDDCSNPCRWNSPSHSGTENLEVSEMVYQ